MSEAERKLRTRRAIAQKILDQASMYTFRAIKQVTLLKRDPVTGLECNIKEDLIKIMPGEHFSIIGGSNLMVARKPSNEESTFVCGYLPISSIDSIEVLELIN